MLGSLSEVTTGLRDMQRVQQLAEVLKDLTQHRELVPTAQVSSCCPVPPRLSWGCQDCSVFFSCPPLTAPGLH